MAIQKTELAGIKPSEIRRQSKYSLAAIDPSLAYEPQELATIWGIMDAAKVRAKANKRDEKWAAASAYKALWVKLTSLIKAGKAVAKNKDGKTYIEFTVKSAQKKPTIAAKGISATL